MQYNIVHGTYYVLYSSELYTGQYTVDSSIFCRRTFSYDITSSTLRTKLAVAFFLAQ